MTIIAEDEEGENRKTVNLKSLEIKESDFKEEIVPQRPAAMMAQSTVSMASNNNNPLMQSQQFPKAKPNAPGFQRRGTVDAMAS